jgi:hypothetical protein
MESRFFSSPPEQDRSVQWPKVLGQIGRIDNDATTIYELKCMFNITFLGNNPDVLKESKPTYGGKYDATAWVIRMCGPLSPVAHVELDTRTNTFTVRGLGKDLPITAALFDRFYPLNIRKVESNGETSKIP